MSSDPRNPASAASALRAAFDESFAASAGEHRIITVDVLAIRVAGQGYALRLSEVLAVHAERKLVPVPAPARELLGLVGLRGLVAPVYDLRLLLGHDAGPAPRWLALARADSPVGVAFDSLEGHLRVAETDIIAARPVEGAGGRFTPGSVRTSSGPRPLLHLPSLLASITRSKLPVGA